MRALPLTAALLLLAPAATGFALAATPAPHATPPKRINVKDLQPRAIFPKKKLHVEMIVEVNKYGQVARVRSIKPSHDPGFDAKAYGNALQAFIRTPDGHVVLGSYRMIYDYDPVSLNVKRDVQLVKAGGVNPNAQGAANQMMEIARRNRTRTPPPIMATGHDVTPAPHPAPSVESRRMPDLPQVMQTPSH
ncbi:MAG TPA: hypothetical protein VGN14_03770 [Candidatus Elarobacter sp.]